MTHEPINPRAATHAGPAAPSVANALVDLASTSARSSLIGGQLALIAALVTNAVAPVGHATVITVPEGTDAGGVPQVPSALSIPLFAATGGPVAVLVLHGGDPAQTPDLASRLGGLYESPLGADPAAPATHPGVERLIAALDQAFAVRDRIHQAVGVLMALQGCSAAHAYAGLIERAAVAGGSLADEADGVLRSLTL